MASAPTTSVRVFANGEKGSMIWWPLDEIEWRGWSVEHYHPLVARCRSACSEGKPFHTDVAWQDVEKDINGWEFFPFARRVAPKVRSPSPVNTAKEKKQGSHGLMSFDGAKSLGAKSPGAGLLGGGGGPVHDEEIASTSAVAGVHKRKSVPTNTADTVKTTKSSRPKRDAEKLTRVFYS